MCGDNAALSPGYRKAAAYRRAYTKRALIIFRALPSFRVTLPGQRFPFRVGVLSPSSQVEAFWLSPRI